MALANQFRLTTRSNKEIDPLQDFFNVVQAETVIVPIPGNTPYGAKIRLQDSSYLDGCLITGVRAVPPQINATGNYVEGLQPIVAPNGGLSLYWSTNIWLTLINQQKDHIRDIHITDITADRASLTTNRNFVPFYIDFSKSYITLAGDGAAGDLAAAPPYANPRAPGGNTQERGVALTFFYLPVELSAQVKPR